jgi:putative transposase
VNRKKVERLYRLEGLTVRTRKRKRVALVPRQTKPKAERFNERWSMDFTHDATADGRAFRTLNIGDDWCRECLAILVARSILGDQVAAILEQMAEQRGLPQAIAGRARL